MSSSLHRDPPFSPRGLMFGHPATIWIVLATSVVLALAAAIDGGSVLLVWDEPIQRWIDGRRSAGLETTFRSFSRMGSNVVVFAVFAVLVAFAARGCRALAVALAVAVLARPLFEFVVKELVDRNRPDLGRLVPGTGPSHPSGHVLAAMTLWGLLPPLVALRTDKRWIWWSTAIASAVLIAGISASRMYLGVHWFSDIVQGFLLGWMYLVLIETLFMRQHEGRRCNGSVVSEESPSAV